MAPIIFVTKPGADVYIYKEPSHKALSHQIAFTKATVHFVIKDAKKM